MELHYRTWGGRRKNAGRKPTGARSGVSHRRREPLASRFPVSVTLRVREHVPSLRRGKAYQLVREALEAASERGDFRVVEFSVQTNHIHLIVEAHHKEALARGMQALSIRIAKGLNRLMETRGKVLADRYHARILRTPRAVRFALRYVLNNRRKHAELPLDPMWRRWIDPCSSALWFDGWSRKPDLSTWPATARRAERFLPRARTWLLRRGWRRHGLIDPASAPKAPAPS